MVFLSRRSCYRVRFKNHPLFCRFGPARASRGCSPNLPFFCRFFVADLFRAPRGGHFHCPKTLHFYPVSPNFYPFGALRAPKGLKTWPCRIKTESFRTMEMSPAGCPEKVCNKKNGKNNGKFREHPREARGGPKRQKKRMVFETDPVAAPPTQH